MRKPPYIFLKSTYLVKSYLLIEHNLTFVLEFSVRDDNRYSYSHKLLLVKNSVNAFVYVCNKFQSNIKRVYEIIHYCLLTSSKQSIPCVSK